MNIVKINTVIIDFEPVCLLITNSLAYLLSHSMKDLNNKKEG
ncbi:MAG: hypothetical protein ACJA2S_004509 [Cyclobacteriaceae bacterium]|jgi:hypothetical protein